MSFSRFFAILGLVAVGVLSRLLPHPPNCTAINAIALFSAFQMRSCPLSFATVCITLFVSDLALGFHPMMPFVYFSFGLICLMGFKLKCRTVARIPLISVVTSLLFFFVTNFGEWFSGSLYPKTMNGLYGCYLAAIPFFGNQVFGDLCYNILFFGLLQLQIDRYFKTKNVTA